MSSEPHRNVRSSWLVPCDRDRQLSWLVPGARIRQDQDLIDYIAVNKFKRCCTIGDGVEYFRSYIDFTAHGTVDFCMCIQNSNFDLDELIDKVNHVIQEQLNPDGKIYLALNRYQIKPKRYAPDLSDDFDTAIEQYVTMRILARVDRYIPCGDDGGNKFNWVHPLTRFYLSKKS